jgi:hypothetical protein
MAQPNEKAATSLRLSAPALGLSLAEHDVAHYLEMVDAGLIQPENDCDKGMQDDYALRPETTTPLITA